MTTLESIAASGAAAENNALDQSQQTSDVATPNADSETQQQDGGQPAPLTPEQRLEKERAKFERRIARKHASEAQAHAENRLLRERLASLEQQQQRQSADPQDSQQQQQRQPQGLDPQDVQRLIREEATRLAQQNGFSDRVGRVLQSGKAIEGFDELTNTVNDEMPFSDRDGKPTPFLRALMDSDKPAELIAHLGKNPDLLEGLQDLTEGQLNRRLDRIEQSIKQEARPSKAPAPLKPPAGSSGSGGAPSADSPDYLAWKLKKLRGG